MLYWISDANGPKPYDRGIFRCALADIANPKKLTLLFNPQVESANMVIQDGVILASHCAPAAYPGSAFGQSSYHSIPAPRHCARRT
jgi:hypothetical protein